MTTHSATGSFTGTGSFGISGFDYATIVNGVVTAITLGASSIPASTSTTLYIDITTYSPQPAVGYFYDELCDVFTPTPPTIPPGSIAPPVPPGGTYPPGAVLPPAVTPTIPPPDTMPVHVHFHADGGNSYPTLTAWPSVRTPLSDAMHTAFDAQRCYEVSLHTTVGTVGTSCMRLAVEWSSDPDDPNSWLPMAEQHGPFVRLNVLGSVPNPSLTGVRRFQASPAMVAAGDVWLRLVGEGGDGVASPVVYNIHIIAYMAMDPQAITTPVTTPVAPIYQYALCADDFQGTFPSVPNYVDAAALEIFQRANILWQARTVNNQIGPGGETVWDFDNDYFDGHRAIVSYHGDNDADTGTIVGIGLAGFATKGVATNPQTEWDDHWIRAAIEVECGFNLPADGTGVNSLRGLRLIQQNHHSTLVSDNGLVGVSLKLSDNLIKLVTVSSASGAGGPFTYQKDNLGPASDIIGQGMLDIIIHSKKMSATQWRFRIYIGPPGDIGIPRYAEVFRTVPTGTVDLMGNFTFLQDILPVANTNNARKRTWLGRWDFVPESMTINPYQVIP